MSRRLESEDGGSGGVILVETETETTMAVIIIESETESVKGSGGDELRLLELNLWRREWW